MSQYATIDPATGRMIKEFEVTTDSEIEIALDEATRGHRDWADTPVSERMSVLGKIASLHREHADDLAKLSTQEVGKPLAQARAEIELTANVYDYFGQHGPELLEEERLTVPGGGTAVVSRASIGPVLGVMPWNFPFSQVARFVAPNLLLGNTILLKHASNCPQLSDRIGKLISQAGAPLGVYRNLYATKDQIAKMIADPRLRGVSVTGSERAGSIIAATAGQHLKKCVLELGGSDPFLVLAGANLPAAAKAAAQGRFTNAGQACTSSKRIIVLDSLWDDFMELFINAVEEYAIGDPMEPGTTLGPMSTAGGRKDIVDQVDDAVGKGATVHMGGSVPAGPGNYYPATVLSSVTPEMRAYREELFGPVAVLHRVNSVEAAIELANDSPYGLGSVVFTDDAEEANYVSRRLEVGMVSLNTTTRSFPNLPFGGVKNSGVGRELGRYGLDEFANIKLVRSI
jgi:acyl-CoA reductase-like NAD-dependent aldehyde dehydrogenase